MDKEPGVSRPRMASCRRRPTTLLREEWIETELADKPRSYIQALAASFGVSPPARILQCTSLHLAVELAAELGAICCMSASALPFFEERIRAGGLTPLNVIGDLPDMNCVLVCNSEDLLTPAAREFSKILRQLGKESAPLAPGEAIPAA